MKSSSKIWIAVLVVVALLAIYGFTSYNSLVTLDENATAQWKQVETQYQRRFDLIPNLVELAKGVMKQEQAVFSEIAEARTRYSGAQSSGSVDDQVRATAQLDSALSRLLVITENYPVLKSSENIQTVMSQLEGTENRISVERGRFNDSVKAFNLAVKRFPGSIMASLFGFDERVYFDADSAASVAPKITM